MLKLLKALRQLQVGGPPLPAALRDVACTHWSTGRVAHPAALLADSRVGRELWHAMRRMERATCNAAHGTCNRPAYLADYRVGAVCGRQGHLLHPAPPQAPLGLAQAVGNFRPNFRPFRKPPTVPETSDPTVVCVRVAVLLRAPAMPTEAFPSRSAGAPPALAGVECGETWRQRWPVGAERSIFFYCFAIVGMLLFRSNDPHHFGTNEALARSLRPSPLPRPSTLQPLHAARVLPSPFTPRADGRTLTRRTGRGGAAARAYYTYIHT